MADKEFVITHLQIIHTWAEFARERDLQFFTKKHLEDIAQWSEDAINLLKEREEIRHGEWKWSHGGECSECGYHNSDFNYKYCPMCGAMMDA